MVEEKNIRTVEEWVKANNPWSIIHMMRVPKPVSTRIIDVTGIDDRGWDSLMGRLKTQN